MCVQVGLSRANFQKDTPILWATVTDRKDSDLYKGILKLKMLSLDGDMLDLRALSGQRFALIESSAYYEAYVHTLKALQARDTMKKS